MHSSSVGSELGSSQLAGLLLLGGDTRSDQLKHLLLKWGEASNFLNDSSHHLASVGDFALAEDWSFLPLLLLWSLDDVSVVKSNEQSSFSIRITHPVSFLPSQTIINNLNTFSFIFN